MMSFVKTEEEESNDSRFSLELADEEQKEQAPLGSNAKIISSITTHETLPEAGEAVTDSGQLLRPTNRYTAEEHERLKQLNRQYSRLVRRKNRMDHGQEDQLLRGAQRFTPEELETRRKRRISNFFLQDANERQGLTKQTSSRRILSRDPLQLPSSSRQLISTRSKCIISTRSKCKITQEDLEERKITRSELEEIFLEGADALVSEERIDHIFLQADTEGTGFVHADDVADYINSIEPRTQKERQNCIYRSILVSISFWCYIFFAIGSVANIITNLRQREYGDLHGISHYYWQVGAWTFQIGCLGLFFLDYDSERIEFEHLQLMNQKLVRWIRRGTYPIIEYSFYHNLEELHQIKLILVLHICLVYIR
jgi:hypothetical protein